MCTTAAVEQQSVGAADSDPLVARAAVSDACMCCVRLLLCLALLPVLCVQGSCAVGQTPKLPLVANAANTQIRDGPSGF
jgi:hypothetical protein